MNSLKRGIPTASLAAALLAGGLLSMARFKGPSGILLLDRFVPGLGWLQILLIAAYAGVVSYLLLTKSDTSRIRIIIWNLFSVVFFTQLLTGIFISKTFLMSGTLHIPVPAVILAGPLYEGRGFFMPILFISTILLIGPAWCSHLCYFGSWDGVAASRRGKPVPYSKKWTTIRWSVLFLVILVSLAFRLWKVPLTIAAAGALAFGIVGIILMVTLSRTRGFMVHCTAYCPIGLIGNILGKISPFRITIDSNCLFCMKCTETCRYNALTLENMKSGKAGSTCTLCGDCISSCSKNSISYSFFKLSPEKSRTLFVILISAIHAAFLGIARI